MQIIVDSEYVRDTANSIIRWIEEYREMKDEEYLEKLKRKSLRYRLFGNEPTREQLIMKAVRSEFIFTWYCTEFEQEYVTCMNLIAASEISNLVGDGKVLLEEEEVHMFREFEDRIKKSSTEG